MNLQFYLFSKPDIQRINFEFSNLSNKVIPLNYVWGIEEISRKMEAEPLITH